MTMSWVAASGAGIFSPRRQYHLPRVSQPEETATTRVKTANADSDCDCMELWECLTAGGDCTLLQNDMDACLVAQKAVRKSS